MSALYSLAIGYGGRDPTVDLEYTGTHPDVGDQRVPSTFGNILARPFRRPESPAVSVGGTVKAGQTIRLRRRLPVAGHVTCRSTVDGVYDTGRHALVDVVSIASDPDDGTVAVETRSRTLLLGRGSWGGPPPPPSDWEPPDDPPDEHIRLHTRPEQALLYSLLGDNHPLHWSRSVAAKAGFRAPILHGLATFGIIGRVLATVIPGFEQRLPEVTMRFRGPVHPGQDIIMQIWRRPSGAIFRAHSPDGSALLDQGEAFLEPTAPTVGCTR
jgi:acyl dehydratase